MKSPSPILRSQEVWRRPPTRPTLAEREVHVWHVYPLATATDADRALLSADERERASRFHFDRDGGRFIACRAAVRKLLGKYSGQSPERIGLTYGPYGKPSMPGTDLRFNVSHAQDHAMIAVARGVEVGIDVECLPSTLNPVELANQFFAPAEAAIVRDAASDHQALHAFLTIWTRKEAWLKAIGTGLSQPPDGFDVARSWGRDGPLTVIDPRTKTSWCIQALNAGPQQLAAVVTQGEVLRISHWEVDGC